MTPVELRHCGFGCATPCCPFLVRLVLGEEVGRVLREISVTEQRYQAVLAVLSGVPVTEVAGRFGVGRQSVHRDLIRVLQIPINQDQPAGRRLSRLCREMPDGNPRRIRGATSWNISRVLTSAK